jgi:hypothetical protein
MENFTNKKIIKNLLVFYLSFLLIFAASNGVISVQSVLSPEANIGFYSQISIYSIQIPLSIIFPSIVIQLLGFKKSMLLGELGFTIYIAANAYPQ